MQDKVELWIKQFQKSEKYAKIISEIYRKAIKEAAMMGMSITFNPNKPFRFQDYPQLTLRTEKLFNFIAKNIYSTIKNGCKNSFEYSNLNNDELVDDIFSTLDVPKSIIAGYKTRNLEALKVFEDRRIGAINTTQKLSSRVWNLTAQFKQELEMAIDLGIGEAKSAQQLSQDVRQYLNEPNKLFRKVRDKHGALQLSKNAKAYHPGQGVYRSSYKNAMRLTRTEINMAYRQADSDRWKEIPFVVGIEIKLSNAHVIYDMCDDLVGFYPKSFVFRGFHPHCRCITVPVLATKAEIDQITKLQIKGQDVSNFKSERTVKKLSNNYHDWIKKNEKRILRAKTTPFWIQDNYKNGLIKNGLKFDLP